MSRDGWEDEVVEAGANSGAIHVGDRDGRRRLRWVVVLRSGRPLGGGGGRKLLLASFC
ncbi:unnamed protein product [Linum tenue]|uniref:Uncharacterized protein n=1 Tax=Linum tenue TaxID=586396 RepID=A0AAV0REA7_9ROSI|nr:unnamed protein product [Linum tenue]